jgi:hypothetical protein
MIKVRNLGDQTMMQVEWGWSRARIWLQTLPNWVTEQSEVTERRLVTEAPRMSRPASAAVEIVLPGPKCRYGALGATFVPDGTNTLVLRVLHSATMGALITDSLVGRIDMVHQGLLTEYVPGILDDAHTAATVTVALALGPGVLSFSCAAHGEIRLIHP